MKRYFEMLLISFLCAITLIAPTTSAGQAATSNKVELLWRLALQDVLRNLDVLAARRDVFPIDVVQIDDGYQRAVRRNRVELFA